MAHSASLTRTFVLRARRDTVLLVGTAIAMTFALSYAVHSHRVPARSDGAPQQAWTGQLAEVAVQEVASAEGAPLTSASLVVPRSDLALPPTAVRALVKLHGCDGLLCTPRMANSPAPPRRPVAAGSSPAAGPVGHPAQPHHEKPGLLARLNPLNHLPDASTLRRPFSVAGDTVSGWFKRF